MTEELWFLSIMHVYPWKSRGQTGSKKASVPLSSTFTSHSLSLCLLHFLSATSWRHDSERQGGAGGVIETGSMGHGWLRMVVFGALIGDFLVTITKTNTDEGIGGVMGPIIF
jgi:hypothetical protein